MDETLDSYLEFTALEKNLAAATLDAYSRDLRDLEEWLAGTGRGPADAEAGDIADYLNRLTSGGYSASTVRRKLSAIRGYYRFLTASGVRESDPAELLHAPARPLKLPHAVSVETVKSMIEVWGDDSPLSTRNRALLELAYGAGLRESELTSMTVSRVMLDEALVRPMGKGSRERIVPIGGQAVRWLSRYIDRARPLLSAGRSTPVLFLTYRGNPLSRMAVWNVVRKSAEMAGAGAGVHPHTLRHSFATHMLQGGADLRVVQELLGHADISTTEIYTGVDRTWLRNTVDRCHPRSRDG